MKHIFLKSTFAAALTMALAGCSDDFLAEMRPYGSFSYDEVYSDMTSVNLRLNYIYQKSLPCVKTGSNTSDNWYPDVWPTGLKDVLSANTEEFTGYGNFRDPSTTWDYTNIYQFFYYNINESPWKKIRECNDVMEGIYLCENSSLTDEEKLQSKSQAQFFRATRYYRLFKRYGGLPIIDHVQSTKSSDEDSLNVVRSSTQKTFDFIISDLTTAGDNLPDRWEEEANDWGRITSGCAYAMAGIVANYYASPVFNRADDETRWQEAYDLNTKAIEKLTAGGFGLAYESDPGTNASNWAKIWGNILGSDGSVSEAVYIKICNNAVDDENWYNAWEQNIRPDNVGGGSLAPSAEMVDLFPMADGKRPEESSYTYNSLLFFLNRDPRFYRTFTFPGEEWAFTGKPDTTMCPVDNGADYSVHSFAWYNDLTSANDNTQTGYYDDMLGSSGQSVYIRKRSLDSNLSGITTGFLSYDTDNYFAINAQPVIAIRFTEVLLNLAEAAAGINKLDEAYDILVRIRKRVGYTGDCGLDEEIKSDRAKMFAAILYERQIELAYEGKRFDDCHRWMLFDGGAGQEALDASWALTAWDGNTCTYLGVTPLDDTPIHKLEIYYNTEYFTGEFSETQTKPMAKLGLSYPTALTLEEDFTATTATDGTTTYANAQVQTWANFYTTYMYRKNYETMTSDSENGSNPYWDPKLYLMGIQSGDQQNNPAIAQTIGWQSYFGGMGLYDPLSENPNTDSGYTE